MFSTWPASTCSAPSVGSRARGALVGLLAAATVATAAACTPTYAPGPVFRCEGGGSDGGAGLCPTGYYCASEAWCVPDGTPTPVRLTNRIEEAEAAFSIHPGTDDVIVCWSQSAASRDPGIFAARIGPTTALLEERSLWVSPVPSSSTLLTEQGACARRGNELTMLVLTNGMVAERRIPRALRFPTFGASPVEVSGTSFGAEFRAGTRSNFTGTLVGDEVWFTFPIFIGAGAPVAASAIAQLPIDSMQSQLRTPALLVLDNPYDPPLSSELFGGTNGAWGAVLLPNGVTKFAWADRQRVSDPMMTDVIRDAPSPVPAADYDRAVPLAVRETQLAAAFRRNDGSWQVYWMGATASDPCAMGCPGPTLQLAAGMLRPGGYVAGSDLIVAAAGRRSDGANDNTHITLWTIPWGGTTATPWSEQIAKITPVAARRVSVTRVANRMVAVWTERVAAESVESTGYTLLFAGSIPAQ
jgi:hypothetical protein